MTTLFDANFTFSPTPSTTTPSSPTTPPRSISPFSDAAVADQPSPPPRLSVTDLASQFASHRIRREAPGLYYTSCESYANTDDDEAGWTLPPSSPDEDEPSAPLSRSRTIPQRPSSPGSRRAQRQSNTRLLCSSAHLRDVQALVKRMVEANEQCDVAPPPTASLTPTHSDEGYSSESEEMSGLSQTTSRRSSLAAVKSKQEFRRGSEVRGAGASVSKNVRLRKKEGGQRRARRESGRA